MISMCQLQLHEGKNKSALLTKDHCVMCAAHSSNQLHRRLLSDSSPADHTEPDTTVTHPEPDIACGTHRIHLLG